MKYLITIVLTITIYTPALLWAQRCDCDLQIPYEPEEVTDVTVEGSASARLTPSKRTVILNPEIDGMYRKVNTPQPVSERTHRNILVGNLAVMYCAILQEKAADLWAVEKSKLYWSPRYNKLVAKVQKEFGQALLNTDNKRAPFNMGLMVTWDLNDVIVHNNGLPQLMILSAFDADEEGSTFTRLVNRNIIEGENRIPRSEFSLPRRTRLDVVITTDKGEMLLNAVEPVK